MQNRSIYTIFLIIIIVGIIYYMYTNNMFEHFSDDSSNIEDAIIQQLATRFKISPSRIKLYNIIYVPDSRVLDFEIEIMNIDDKTQLQSSSVYEQLSKLINSRAFKLNIKGNDVSINKLNKSDKSMTSHMESYSDPSLFKPAVFKEEIGYLENTIKGFHENKDVTNFWSINLKTGKLVAPEFKPVSEEEM
jgi:hypothetical protein